MGSRKYFFLYPFAILYQVITDIRNYLYDTGILRSKKFALPVISVGNITVGGTGKTPHTEYLAGLLQNDFKVAVLSRGYRRRSSGFRIASGSSVVSDVGDEPLQISRKFPGIIVAVDRDRVKGISTILKKFPETEVIILDDAFQHRRISPGLSILLSVYDRLVMRDYLLPYGRLRESRKNMKRANLILITKIPEDSPGEIMESIRKETETTGYQKLFFTTFRYGDPVPLFETDSHLKIYLSGMQAGYGVVLVTGIADPGSFKQFLAKCFKEMIHLEFSDHHCFSENDIKRISFAWNNLESPCKVIITTEKDSVRLKEHANIPDVLKRALFYVPVSIDFLNNSKQEFDEIIFEYVRKYKRNS